MPNFSPEEKDLIDKQKKPTEQMPYYYLARRKTLIQISEDFEAYLILQTAAAKAKIQTWLKKTSDANLARADRDEILKRYLDLRKVDSQKVIESIDKKLDSFDEFKTSLLGTPEDANRYASVTELNEFTEVVQRPVDELTLLRETAYMEQNITALADKYLTEYGVSKDTQREINSWKTVFASYQGQPGGAQSKSNTLSNIRNKIGF